MKITIVTPVLNSARYLRQSVESILAQRGEFELEYIVKDGGSTDGTLELLAEYGDELRVISSADNSLGDAINQGMEAAQGEIAGWVNGDDLLRPGALQQVCRVFQDQPQRDWLTGRCTTIDEAGEEIRRLITFYINLMGGRYSYNRLLTENFINQPATFWRTTLWRDIGGIDTNYRLAFDYKLWLEMGKRSDPLYLPEYLADFRRHAVSLSSRHYHQQFQEELDIGRSFCEDRWLNFLHWLKVKRTVTIYNVIG